MAGGLFVKIVRLVLVFILCFIFVSCNKATELEPANDSMNIEDGYDKSLKNETIDNSDEINTSNENNKSEEANRTNESSKTDEPNKTDESNKSDVNGNYDKQYNDNSVTEDSEYLSELDFFTNYLRRKDVNGFITCEYLYPYDVNLNEVLYSYDSGEYPSSDIYDKVEYFDDGDIFMYPSKHIDELLQKNMGISFKDVKKELEYLYIPEDDAYYHEVYDTNYAIVQCIEVTKDSKYIYIKYERDGSEGLWQVTLRQNNEDYLFVSNYKLDRLEAWEYFDTVNYKKDKLSSIEDNGYTYFFETASKELIYVVEEDYGESMFFQNSVCILITNSYNGNAVNWSNDYYEETGEPIYSAFIELLNNHTPYSFDAQIPDMLVEQINLILNGEELSLPKDYSLLDYCEGDLNMDVLSDVVVAIEQAPGNYSGSRRLYIFMNDNESYNLRYQNKGILLGNQEGGVLGDPYSDISIEDGKLYVSDYGGSSERWGHIYVFESIEEQLILSNIIRTDFNTHEELYTEYNYDLLEKKHEIFQWGESSYEYELAEILYIGKININWNITFNDAYAWCENDLIIEDTR